MTNKQYIDTVLVSTSKEIIKQCDLERYSYHWDKMLESEALIKDFHETCEKCGVAYHNKSAILWYLWSLLSKDADLIKALDILCYTINNQYNKLKDKRDFKDCIDYIEYKLKIRSKSKNKDTKDILKYIKKFKYINWDIITKYGMVTIPSKIYK